MKNRERGVYNTTTRLALAIRSPGAPNLATSQDGPETRTVPLGLLNSPDELLLGIPGDVLDTDILCHDPNLLYCHALSP